MPRIRYADAVRAQAVRLVLESQKPLAQVARTFGCSVSALQHWLKAHRQGTQTTQPGVKKSMQAVADKEASPLGFIPVNLIDQKSPTVAIITPDGFTLKLTDTHPQYIAELLRILGSC
jgi:hypothetical protein